MTRRQKAIDDIARYFTGPVAVHHRICLELGGAHEMSAHKFFGLRERLGIKATATKAEAVHALLTTLGDDQ